MGREPRDDIEREVGALELRVGVDHDGNVDGVGNGAEIGFHARIAKRKIRFQDRQNAVGTKPLIGLGLRHRIRDRGRDHARDHGHAAFRRRDRGLDHGRALRGIEIGEFAGRAERCQPVHTGGNEIVAELTQHFRADPA